MKSGRSCSCSHVFSQLWQIDLHIHSRACDDLLQQKQGRDWKLQDVLRFLPEMLQFTKDMHRYFKN